MGQQTSKSGKKGVGRSNRKPACLRYKATRRWEKNKVRRIVKHMLKFPNYTPYNLSLEISDMVKRELKKAAA